MKNMSKYTRIIVTILVCFQLLGVFTSISFAQEEIDIVDTVNTTDSYANDIELQAVISAPIVDINTPIRVLFDTTNVLSYAVEVDGLIATEVEQGSMEYDLVATEEYGILDVYVVVI